MQFLVSYQNWNFSQKSLFKTSSFPFGTQTNKIYDFRQTFPVLTSKTKLHKQVNLTNSSEISNDKTICFTIHFHTDNVHVSEDHYIILALVIVAYLLHTYPAEIIEIQEGESSIWNRNEKLLNKKQLKIIILPIWNIILYERRLTYIAECGMDRDILYENEQCFYLTLYASKTCISLIPL